MRRLAIVLASLPVVTLPVLLAAPAHAANSNISVVCNFGGTVGINPSSSISGAVANDTVTINGLGGISNISVTLSGVTGAASITSTPVVYTITSASPSYITFTVVSSGGGTCDGASATLSINGGTPGGGSSSTSASSGPAPLVQQFGLPASGTCDSAAPSILNWGGAESGGWSESWAEWMNGGVGGAVCTRTLAYRSSTGMWSAA